MKYVELTGETWKNYSTPSIDMNNSREHNEYYEEEKLETVSVGGLLEYLFWMKQNAELNHKDPYEVPVLLNNGSNNYVIKGVACGNKYNTIKVSEYDKLVFTAPDSRPAGGGEYWSTRAVGYDLAGFVVSKAAGERLRRLVRYVLEKDETDSYLDYREQEPNWIQFKFKDTEFDLQKLHQMSIDNDGIVNEYVLRECKK